MKRILTGYLVYYTAILCTLLLVLTTPVALSDEWSQGETEELPARSPENRIIKWCQKDGSHQRYASANLRLKGYEPCGKLKAFMTCDAGGNRMFGSDENRPKGHLDCGIGPRIMIINYDEDDVVDKSAMASSTDQIKELSTAERKNMKDELARLKKQQQMAPQEAAAQLQAVIDALTKYLAAQQGGGLAGARAGAGKKKGARELEKELTKILEGLDPQTKKRVKRVLKK